ncbi:hypothetical protein V1525DRAFT_409474 [Lipomyces kononenkoae]|uniref:Uncharacterized protein n=1 Tax=Lipomyces kononenkoae TaxID=34357 RepID=A0ACC3SVP8_LIPKO
MSSPPHRSSPEDDNYMSEPSPEDLLARFSALSAPTHEPRLREPSPDALGSIDALTDRFTKIFNRGPVSGSTHPVTSYSDESIDPRIFLASSTTSEPMMLKEEHKWKELAEVDENDFEEALRELSAKEWELSADDLAELQYLESTFVVPADAKNGDSGMMNGGYLKALADNLNSKARDENKPANIVEESLDQYARESETDDEKRLGSYKLAEKADLSDGADASEEKELDENAEYSEHHDTDPVNASTGHVAEFHSDQRDIEQQADRLVKMIASSGIRDNSLNDEGDDYKDEDEEADELVDMYVRLASDDEDDERAGDIAKQGVEGNIVDDDWNDDMIARLQNLKLPQTDLEDSPAPKVIDAADLPEVPTVILPSVTTNNNISNKLREDAELGCCMCSDDVEYRCSGCEKLDEDYLYCSKCFLLSHLSEQAGFDERSHRYKKFSL